MIRFWVTMACVGLMGLAAINSALGGHWATVAVLAAGMALFATIAVVKLRPVGQRIVRR